MIVGVPKEIRMYEHRVAMTPAVAAMFRQSGHQVLVETNAGLASGFSDEQYVEAGAVIVPSAQEAWEADMVMKVKEPLPEEYPYFREGLILFTYLHLAAQPDLTAALLRSKVTALAYETVQLDNGSLPLLMPMSEVAGRMSIQIGCRFLENTGGGKGILLGGVPGVEPAKVTVLGGGIVGVNAAKMALGLGADVTILDINADRLRQLDDQFRGKVKTLFSNPVQIGQAVRQSDLLIGAVLVPGARTPKLVTEEMIQGMRAGSVVVDVAIDQGGSIATITGPTTHDQPTFVQHGVIHYAVSNIPGAVARTSTQALSNVTAAYSLQIAGKGVERAVLENRALAKGVNTFDGKLTCQPVAEAHGIAYTTLEEALKN